MHFGLTHVPSTLSPNVSQSIFVGNLLVKSKAVKFFLFALFYFFGISDSSTSYYYSLF